VKALDPFGNRDQIALQLQAPLIEHLGQQCALTQEKQVPLPRISGRRIDRHLRCREYSPGALLFGLNIERPEINTGILGCS
jgi:hypothetical protein